MIALDACLRDSLLYIGPRYTVAEGTDIALRVRRCPSWGDEPMAAIVNGWVKIEADGDALAIPAELVRAPRVTVTLYAGERVASNVLEILVHETIGGETR